jgi:uncharacterized membrane protein
MNEYSDQLNSPYWGILLRFAIILAAALVAGRNVRHLKGGERADRTYKTHAVIFVAVLTFLILFISGLIRHNSFHSKAWDLAIFDQVVWNLANGNGWECSVRGVLDLRGDHFSPILLIFVPLYKIYPHVGWLLAFQAMSLVGTGLILWHTYRSRIGYTSAYLFFAAYCMFPPIHWLALADFHPIAMAPVFIAIGWWGRYNQKVLPFISGLIGMSLCGEEALIVAGWWGLWEMIVRRPRLKDAKIYEDIRESNKMIGYVGLAFTVIFWAGFYYLATKFIPSHRIEGEGYFYIHRYAYLGGSIGEMVKNFFMSPGLWLTRIFSARSAGLLLLYLSPLCFLPVLRPKTLLLLLPTAIYTLISESPEQTSIYHQYTSIWIPFLMIATVESLILPDIVSPMAPNLRRAKPLFVAALLGTLSFSPIIGWSQHWEWFKSPAWAAEARGLIQSIDPDQPVSAPSALCPHLSHRRDLLWKDHVEWSIEGDVLVIEGFEE